ncbi:MAG: prenyltransferase/squalene oxidase repeat-containing protein [Verrucomicrobiota bacterium]
MSRTLRNTLPAYGASGALMLACLTGDTTWAQAKTEASVTVRHAIEQGLELVQKAARNYPDHRVCFSCHHQTLPMFAMATARDRGFTIDEALLEEQAEFTRDFYRGRVKMMREGKGVGGRGMTAGYALWAFDLADQAPDEVTDGLVSYLLKTQEPDGHWKLQSKRPPLEESTVTATFLAGYYMELFADQETVSDAVDRAKQWVETAKPKSQEDLNFKLLAAAKNGGDSSTIYRLRTRILDRQDEDGSWRQIVGMPGDAYATGQTLLILLETRDGSTTTALAIERGIAFLLKDRKADGSWHVKSRSKPIQKLFDNGDPHGTDQFISTAATAWAVAALAWSLPEEEARP